MSQPAYNLRAIRKLLSAVFKRSEDLYIFCTDFSEFKPVTEQFSAGMGKDQMIQHLIEYCERKVLMTRLLEVVKVEDPAQYALFESEIFGEKRIETPLASNLPTIPDESEQLQKLLIQNTRILYELQLQEAQYGLATPPHIKIQIEDLENKIDELKRKLHLKG